MPGARLAAFWLAYGRSDDVVLTTLMRDLGLDDAGAADAIDQAKAWLGKE